MTVCPPACRTPLCLNIASGISPWCSECDPTARTCDEPIDIPSVERRALRTAVDQAIRRDFGDDPETAEKVREARRPYRACGG